MRRIIALITLAGSIGLAAPAGAQVAPEVPWLSLELTNNQIMYWHGTPGYSGTDPRPFPGFAGYVGVPNARPVRVSSTTPKAPYIKWVTNRDNVKHHLRQCGAAREEARCVFLRNSGFDIEIGPGEVRGFTVDSGKINNYMWFSCTIHPWMRGLVFSSGS